MFGKKKDKPLNSLHPDLKKRIKPIIKLKDGDKEVQFYEFETLDDMPARRFSALNDFIEDKNRGITREELFHNLDELIKEIESNSMKGVTNALILSKWMKTRMLISNDVDIVLRLLSCAIFTKEEDLTKYDWDIGTWKIELMEKNGMLSFFLSESISKYWTLTPISAKDMKVLIEERETKARVLKELKGMGISVTGTYTETSK